MACERKSGDLPWGRGTGLAIGPVLVAALSVWLLLVAPPARAAAPSRYVYEMCDSVLPGGGVAGVVFAQHPTLPFAGEDDCELKAGALVVRQGEISPGGGAEWAVPVTPPPGGTLESITITAARCGGPGASGYVFLPGWPAPDCEVDVRTFPLGPDFDSFLIEQQCLGLECHPGPAVAARWFATTVRDPLPPQLSGLGGSLLSPGTVRGHRYLEVSAHDRGGGVSRISVLVNGIAAAPVREMSCATAYTQNSSVTGTVAATPTPCPADANARWTLDAGSFPFHSGSNAVQVCAEDFATLGDPNLTCLPARTVEVDASCPESTRSGGRTLSAHFVGSSVRAKITVGYRQPAFLRGRLTGAGGHPIAGASLCLKELLIGAGRSPVTLGSTRTDGGGRYRYRVPPGPSREIVVGYRRNAELLSRSVAYLAHTRPTIALAPGRVENGESIRIWGSLPDPAAGGRVLVLQAGSVGSKRWRPFRQTTSGRDGRFRASYRFTDTPVSATYRIRALVPRQAGYPWLQGTSKPAEVVVEG